MSARDVLDQAMTETEFQRAVTDLATTFGWLWHHNSDSRRATSGLPDLILVRVPRVIIAELKTEAGMPTNEQLEWLAKLAQCPGVEARLWRPCDLDAIERTLR